MTRGLRRLGLGAALAAVAAAAVWAQDAAPGPEPNPEPNHEPNPESDLDSRLGAAPGAALAPARGTPDATAPRAVAVPQILIVNQQRVLAASNPARDLLETEKRLRATVEARLNRVKAELEAEELELTRLRDTMDREEFRRRTRDFDRRVRRERRAAQERGTQLLSFLSEARTALRSALPRVLEGLRRDKGAAILIDAAAVLAADQVHDVTEEAIQRFNMVMEGVSFDPPESLSQP